MTRVSSQRSNGSNPSDIGEDCPICRNGQWTRKSKDLKLRHIKNAHSSVPNLTIFQTFIGSEVVRCPGAGCGKIFDCMANLGRHQGQKKGTSCYAIWRAQKDSQSSQLSLEPSESEEDEEEPSDDGGASEADMGAVAEGDNAPAAVLPPSQHAPPPTPEELAAVPEVWDQREGLLDLVAYFGRHALYVSHHTWKPLIRSISTKLLNQIYGVDDPEHTRLSDAASVAFLLLPGVVRAIQKYKLGRPIDYLRAWDSLPNPPAGQILREADAVREKAEDHLRLQAEKAARRAEPSSDYKRQAAIRRQTQRIERLVFEGRIGAAAIQVSSLDSLLDAREQALAAAVAVPAPPPADPNAIPTPRDTPRLSREQAGLLLRRYNPEARAHMDDLEEWDGDTEPLQIDVPDVMMAIQKSNSHAAAGYTAWTFALVKALTDGQNGTIPWLHAIKRLFNMMLGNRVRRDYWVPSRAVLLPKGDTAWRPLGIGECWYRLLGKTVMLHEGRFIGKALLPLQLGVGMRGGSEIAGRLAQVMLDADPSMAVINLDISNAFNTIPRKLMWRGVCETRPSLCRWFQWAYGAPTELRLSDGSIACMSETGSRQGDPLASLIFCLGFQYGLRELSARLMLLSGALPDPLTPEETTEARERRGQVLLERGAMYQANRPARDDEVDAETGMRIDDLINYFCTRRDTPHRMGLVAYMDDCNVFVPRNRLAEVSQVIVDVFDRSGLILNVNKCQVLYARNPPQVEPHCPFPIQRTGALSMGVPTGPLAYRREQTSKMLEQMQLPIRSIARLSATASFAIARFCINTRASYLARVTDVFEMREQFDRFDTYMDNVVRSIIEADLGLGAVTPEDLQDLRNRVAAEGLLDRVAPGGDNGVIQWATVDDPSGVSLRHAWMMEYVLPRLRGLPLRYGGLGLIRHSGVEGDKAVCMSRGLTLEFLDAHPSLDFIARGIRKWKPVRLGMAEQLRGDVPPFIDEQEPVNDYTMEKTPTEELNDAVDAIYQNLHARVLMDLTKHNMDAERAFFISASYEGSGKWINSCALTSMYYGPYRLRPEEFREALRLRCLVNPLPVDASVGDSAMCICGKDISREMTHCLDCQRFTTSFATQRHNACRDVLAKLVRDVRANDIVAPNVQTEVLVGPNPNNGRIADVIINIQKFRTPCIVDLAIADPAAPFYRERVQSHMVAGAASVHRAEEKRRQYRAIGVQVIPFVLEATGRPSPDALGLLASISDENKEEVIQRYLSLSGLAIQKQNAAAALFLRAARRETITRRLEP